jgi:hypothetical protein
MAECRLYKIAHLQSSRSELRLSSFKPPHRPGPRSIESENGSFLAPPLFLAPDTPHDQIQASCGLSESCPKIGDVPKSPFPTAAVLVSAGTIQ